MSGQDVLTDENTEFSRNGNPANPTDFQVGESVRVKGILQSDNVVLATRIASPPTQEGDQD